MSRFPTQRVAEYIVGSRAAHYITSRLRNSANANLVYVVNYHATYERDIPNLERQFDFFASEFDLISLDEVPARLEAESEHERPGLLITCDDGVGSNFRVAARLLESRNTRGVFMVPASFVRDDTSTNRTLEAERSIQYGMSYIDTEAELMHSDRLSMTVQQVQQLVKRGHTIGVHGNRHLRLGKTRTRAELNGEIVEAKQLLEASIGSNLDVFCWIGGETSSYSSDAARMIAEAGYRFSFMTCCAPVSAATDTLQMHRFNVESSDSIERVRMVLGGFYEAKYAKKRRLVNKITNVA